MLAIIINICKKRKSISHPLKYHSAAYINIKNDHVAKIQFFFDFSGIFVFSIGYAAPSIKIIQPTIPMSKERSIFLKYTI